MKKSILFVALIILAFGCKKKSENYNGDYEFTINAAKTIGASTLVLTNVTDNRCPITANCVGGNLAAKVAFKVTANNAVRDITLCRGECGSLGDAATIMINGTNYNLKLIEVTPYPDFQTQVTKTVKIQLTRS